MDTFSLPFQEMLEQMPDSVIYADTEGKIRFWNAASEQMFGFTAQEALGHMHRHWHRHAASLRSLHVLRSLLGPVGQAHRLTEGDGRPMDRPGESLPLSGPGPPQS